MIDAREQLLSSSPSTHPRRRTTAVSTRAPKRNGASASPKSLPVQRVFSDAEVKPFDQVEWDRRTAEITDDAGKVIFKQENFEAPQPWSVLPTTTAAFTYFYRTHNPPH